MMPKGRGVLCPSCRVQVIIPNGRNAISRRDNKTEICSRCGQLEAVSEYLVYLGLEPDYLDKIFMGEATRE